ncbi:MAG: hypothetical protein IT181_21585 [Acidobacteria bacterium]|nr:hypothetical protein [Acidobacteriota bacterium]
MYPPGHPALARVADGVLQRLARLFVDREQVAIGVARRQLIVEGVATDQAHPVLRRLAESLHAHQLGAVSLLRGVDVAEVSAALRVLATEPEQGGAIGLRPPETRPSWPHIRLHPLTFDNLAIVSGPEGEAAAGPRSSHGAELWLGLAQAALAGDGPRETPAAMADTAPETLARAIDAHTGAQAYDQVIAGYLLQIAQALRSASGAEAEALRARTSGLISALQPATLRRLVRTSRTESGPHEFVRDAVQGLRVDAVLEVLKATADVTGETISHGLIRMLTKLAAHAEGSAARVRTVAEDALRGQVTRLLADWKLADPNPESYGRLLQQLATSVTPDAQNAADEPEAEADSSLRLVQMGLELGDLGTLGSRAATRQLELGGIGPLVHLLDAPPATAGVAADALRERLRAKGVLTRLLASEPVDFAALDALLPSMTVEEHEPVLDALANSESRVTRRRLLDRLVQSPRDLSSIIAARLSDPRWHVLRNMLLLLERTERVPLGFSARPWLTHDDWRVRYEAVRLALTLPADRDFAVRAALAERQPRIIAVGLAALPGECPPALAGLVARLAGDATLPDDTRVLALRVLQDGPEPDTLTTLTALVDGGRTFFGRVKLAPPTPVSLEALRGLAARFADDPAARPYLTLAQASPLPAVREAVSRAES